MELIVLGSGGGWARPGGAACGYLIRHEGFNLWVDLGTGTMANVQRYNSSNMPRKFTLVRGGNP